MTRGSATKGLSSLARVKTSCCSSHDSVSSSDTPRQYLALCEFAGAGGHTRC